MAPSHPQLRRSRDFLPEPSPKAPCTGIAARRPDENCGAWAFRAVTGVPIEIDADGDDGMTLAEWMYLLAQLGFRTARCAAHECDTIAGWQRSQTAGAVPDRMMLFVDGHCLPLIGGERGDATHGGRRVMGAAAHTPQTEAALAALMAVDDHVAAA